MLHSNDRIIKHKIGLLNLAEELGNVSKACQVMGLSRDTLYRYKQAVDAGGVESLLHQDRRRPNPKNRVDEIRESSVLDYALDFPAHGQVREDRKDKVCFLADREVLAEAIVWWAIFDV